ncbi:tRNA (guanosine(46)-N7)-methyltransferase TrmB [Acidithiobacillus sp.]|uniref:tRNA (guanosine(46)-N7)-methyltransferase TrmB n=1 Tax=Acidithiobacillus sp. TaxID=1872118 RepID=UPI0025C2B853|nr:tRNA (guanosine(46)-N7)-methyltransferase TrmB [Acidithiobacillus sp.]
MSDSLKPNSSQSGPDRRPVRSFVLRQGRFTQAQRRAMTELLPRWAIAPREPWTSPWTDGRPLALEIGFGNGEHLAHFAARHPDWGCIGAEVHAPGVGALLQRLETEGIDNVRVLHGDAMAWLATLPAGVFALIVIQFPDPWPKKRHHKRRLLQPESARQLAALLRVGGELQFATDWEPYAEHALAVLSATDSLDNLDPDGAFSPPPENRIPTRFERRGEALGHRVFDLRFRKRSD